MCVDDVCDVKNLIFDVVMNVDECVWCLCVIVVYCLDMK